MDIVICSIYKLNNPQDMFNLQIGLNIWVSCLSNAFSSPFPYEVVHPFLLFFQGFRGYILDGDTGQKEQLKLSIRIVATLPSHDKP